MKFLKKGDFSRKVLAELAPGDSVVVLCDNGSQVASISSMCGQEPRRHPRQDVSSYSYRSAQKDGDWVVNVTAIPS